MTPVFVHLPHIHSNCVLSGNYLSPDYHTDYILVQGSLWIAMDCSGTDKQLFEWFSPSVRLSVTPFLLCSCHRIIMKLSEVITIDRSDVHVKGQGQRSKVKVTEVMTPLSRFRTVTPV